MNAEAVFNRYDIRGDYPDEIDEEFARRLGRAVGTYSQQHARGTVVVGRDTRDASAAVAPPFCEGVHATGADIVHVGTGTTDRTALAASHYGGVGAMVTASHHAWDRTGFKLLYEAGNGFSNEDLNRIEALFTGEEFDTGEGTRINVADEFDEEYAEAVAATIDDLTGGIDARLVVDGIGGADRVSRLVLDHLDVDHTLHGWDEQPDPEPGEENRAAVKNRLAAEDADLAVGYDPDGDRVYAIHPDHGWIDGDRLLYLLARVVEPGSIVASVDTSPLIETVPADITYTRVGDIFVAAQGRETGAELLGEPNGHYAVPSFCWYNSGILSSLLLATVTDQIPGMLDAVARFVTERHTEQYDTMDGRDDAFQQVKRRIGEQYTVLSRVDGVKFEAGGSTALVRPSGTSPKIRLVVHGQGDVEETATKIRQQLFG